jgi:hypothetical protein
MEDSEDECSASSISLEGAITDSSDPGSRGGTPPPVRAGSLASGLRADEEGFELVGPEKEEEKPRKPPSLAILRFLVDLLWVTLLMAGASVLVCAVLRFSVYAGDLTIPLSERSEANFWGIVLFQWIRTWLVMVVVPFLCIWHQYGWSAVKKQFLIWGSLGLIYFLGLRVAIAIGARDGLIPDSLTSVIVALTSVVFALVQLWFVLGAIQKSIGWSGIRPRLLAGIFMWALVNSLYFVVLPPIWLAARHDWERVLIRLLVHPILWELNFSSARMLSLAMPTSSATAYTLSAFTLSAASLWGRFLVSSMESSVTTMFLAVGLGVEEIAMRASIRWRDRQVRKISRGKSPTLELFARPRTGRLYADLAAADIILENSSIITSAALLGLYLSPNGPLEGQLSVSRIAIDCCVQILIEFGTDFFTIRWEVNHGVPVLEAWKARGQETEEFRDDRYPGADYVHPRRREAVFQIVLMVITLIYMIGRLYDPDGLLSLAYAADKEAASA